MRPEFKLRALTDEGLQRELVFLKAEEDRANAFQQLKRTQGGKFLQEYLSDHLEWIRKRYKHFDTSSDDLSIAVTACQVEEIMIEDLLNKITKTPGEALQTIEDRRSQVVGELDERDKRSKVHEYLPTGYQSEETE